MSGKSSGGVSRRKFLAATGTTGALALAGCSSLGGSGGSSSIDAAGSSFVAPLMNKWADEYNKKNDVEVNYRSIGSGAGVSNLMDKTVVFAGSDAPLSKDQYKKVQKEGGCVHIPESLGAIAPVFSVEGVDSLKITGEVLADIFLGNIKKWNDSKLKKLNPDANLPSANITVAHRSDASGTTYGFTGYLSQVSSKWKSQIGQTETPSWPVGVGGKGNEGVSAAMKKQKNAIGYVELTYAKQNDLDVFKMKNKAGKFVEASPEGVSAAASGAANDLPKGTDDWSDVSISNAPGEKSWPISTFTYVIMYKDFGKAYEDSSKEEMKKTLKFVKWAVNDGQQYAPKLHYPKLPSPAAKLDNATLKNMTFNGDTVL
ncbi:MULTISPECIES: phosphate ABC transporter substrate-binding protein PstS [unclassified Haladaptatus]|uniref:phosphate ABC transporter substrate-binding protein PstS n=1 Tax=unclassified Haladaptatus TaxID=2622732 RepID=UPI00209BF2FE|nr:MULTISPECIES: phosphate ABC transporter substrate-binding protein PstS [unclassified Haladaptatus]MCO8243153.1 phosphate ABC transporter substrate-binding protein PstS [Haladaptatus sp. AB643]MCO8252865.1 phosphate ABC transporter substrate-binding protein PstS [Haladaptatus sp. AB618]